MRVSLTDEGGASNSATGVMSSDLPQGRMELDELRLVREIGHGGMATIHLATHVATGREVALKVMHSHLATDPALVRRFLHEVKAQVGLQHPAIVEMIGWGQDARGGLFMAMEYVEGVALKDVLGQGRRLPVDVALHVTREILDGLAAAHARGIVHRDIKPANVMVSRVGEVKVADFGISKAVDMTQLTSTGNVIGTPAYMSPEQALARPLDHRSDLFSVGVVLYEMLMGTNPFQTGNPATTLSRIVHFQQRPVFETLPQTPVAVEELLESLMQKDPEKRLTDAAHAMTLIDRCIQDEELCSSREVLAAFACDPDTVSRKIGARRAKRHFDRGTRAYASGKGNAEAATWEFFLATLHDPSLAEARTWLEQVSRERGYNLQRKAHPRIDELEAQLQAEPDNLPAVLQLAKLHKSQGNFLQVIYYYRRAKALRPPDNYTRSQIETLVSAQAATMLAGTGVFEASNAAPATKRPTPQASVASGITEASTWGETARDLLSSAWGRLGAAGIALLAVVLVAGSLFDTAVQASRPKSGGSADDSAMSEPGIDRQVMFLERGQQHMDAGDAAAAAALYREFLQEFRDSGLRSKVLFRLGDALERDGDRSEALEAHGENARDHLDEWALKSRERRGEIFLVQESFAQARAEYDAITRVAIGEQRDRAVLQLAAISRREGRLSVARGELEQLIRDGSDAIAGEARLALADICELEGDMRRAEQLYVEARDTSDHHSDIFRRASDGVLRAQSAGAVTEAPPSPTEDPVPTMDVPPTELPATSEPPAPVDSTVEPSTEARTADADVPASEPAAAGLLAGLGRE